MLQPKHLAIIRAALTYWDEEMAGADKSVYQHYLHSQDVDVRIVAEDVTLLRQFFSSAELANVEEVSSIDLQNSILLISSSDDPGRL